jgi:phasin
MEALMAVAKKPVQKPAPSAAPVAAAPVAAKPVAAPSAPAPAAPVAAKPVAAAPAPKPAPAAVKQEAKTQEAKTPETKAKAAPKAAAASAPVFLFPVQPEVLKPLNDMQEQFRAGAEKGLEQFRTHYATIKGNAETATDKLEESIAAVQAGTKEFQAKVVDLFRAQADANFTHLRALFGAKSLPDAIKLQQDFAKAQVETIQSETRNLAELAQKVATDVAEPVKASLTASFSR